MGMHDWFSEWYWKLLNYSSAEYESIGSCSRLQKDDIVLCHGFHCYHKKQLSRGERWPKGAKRRSGCNDHISDPSVLTLTKWQGYLLTDVREQCGSTPAGGAGVGGSNRERHTAPGLITLCQAWPTSSPCVCYRRPLCKVRMIDHARWVKQLRSNLELFASCIAGLPSIWNN